MRIALGVEYDGSQFFGWQSQAGGHTVQDTLQAALSSIACQPISVIAAGRTDSGVHAVEQVVHFDTGVDRPLSAWVRGVNAMLPSSIAVLWAHPVSDQFHARFTAQARSYYYVLINRPVRSALYQGKAGWFHMPLAVDKMIEAAGYLLGQHDFSAFRSVECQAKSPVKNMTKLEIQQHGDVLIFYLTANAFLQHMVRNIVGCLVYVGKGKYPPQWLGEVLASGNRHMAAPTFAPDGLYLRKIEYPPTWNLPQLNQDPSSVAK